MDEGGTVFRGSVVRGWTFQEYFRPLGGVRGAMATKRCGERPLDGIYVLLENKPRNDDVPAALRSIAISPAINPFPIYNASFGDTVAY